MSPELRAALIRAVNVVRASLCEFEGVEVVPMTVNGRHFVYVLFPETFENELEDALDEALLALDAAELDFEVEVSLTYVADNFECDCVTPRRTMPVI